MNDFFAKKQSLAIAVLFVAVVAQGAEALATQTKVKSVAVMRAEWGKLPVEELRKAAEKSNAEAAYVYGVQEMIKGREIVNAGFEHSLAAEPTGPVYNRGEVFARWKDVPQDKLLAEVAKQNREAQYYYGHSKSDEGVARTKTGFIWLKRAAELGLSQAQFEVGMFYAERMGYVVVDCNYPEALKWFERAADQGREEAFHQIADIRLEGLIGYPDLSKAVELLQRCVDLGCHRAEFQLAMLYSNGNGEPRHAGETPVTLLKKAIDGRIPMAQIELARRYREGFGVSKNLVRAARFYVRASLYEDTGWAFQNRLKEVFELLTPDEKPKPTANPETFRFAEALAVQLRSLRNNDPAAMMEMAQLELSAASDKDARIFAHYWFVKANRNGVAAASKAREHLEKDMSAGELEQARAEEAEAAHLENIPLK